MASIPSPTPKRLILLLSITLAQLLGSGHAAPAYLPGEIAAQVHLVHQATELLLTRSIQSRESAEILAAAWSGLAQTGPAPADEASFDSAFAIYLARLRTRPTISPAHEAIRAMAVSAAEGHTYFLDPEQRQRYDDASHLEQSYAGVGLGFVGPGLVVSRVLESSPAAQAGVHAGDAIVEVDGRPVRGHATRESAGWLRGPAGSHVNLTIRTPGGSDTRAIDLQRQPLRWQAVSTDVLARDIGYVELSTFEDPAVADAFDAALSNLEQLHVRGLIVDLRGDPGGRLDVGARVLVDLLPPGSPAFQQIDRSGTRALHAPRASHHPPSVPIAVLINGESGSMSELFAAAVHEYHVATLIGQTTAGTVAGGQLFPLDDGSALDVTTSELRSAHGAVLNGRGVDPDIRVDGTRATDPSGDDPAILAAIAFLTR